ncbi:hypothetical protein ACHMXB_12010 [Arthrobacter sp. UC242_113]|uniref:hypothetical protein n=1 Tax=Arthrobacter sp. UC242_113 TaxID=3374550 RepID=UPI003756A37C
MSTKPASRKSTPDGASTAGQHLQGHFKPHRDKLVISTNTPEQTLEAARVPKKPGTPTKGEDAFGKTRQKVRTRREKPCER